MGLIRLQSSSLPSGSVLQRKIGTFNSLVELTSTSFVDTGVSALSITRTKNDSIIHTKLMGGRWRLDSGTAPAGFLTSFYVSENSGSYTTLGTGADAAEFWYFGTTDNLQGAHSAHDFYTPASNVTTIDVKIYAAILSNSVKWSTGDTNGATMVFEVTEIAA